MDMSKSQKGEQGQLYAEALQTAADKFAASVIACLTFKHSKLASIKADEIKENPFTQR